MKMQKSWKNFDNFVKNNINLNAKIKIGVKFMKKFTFFIVLVTLIGLFTTTLSNYQAIGLSPIWILALSLLFVVSLLSLVSVSEKTLFGTDGTLMVSVGKSWLGLSMIALYVGFTLTGDNQILTGAFAVFAAVLTMNGLANTEVLFPNRSPSYWRSHPILNFFHKIQSEGELAGVFIGIVIALCMFFGEHEHPHVSFAAVFTLIGIVAAANLAIRDMKSVMIFLESKIGIGGALFVGAFLSSLSGAAASVFVCETYKNRVKNPDEFAVKFAASLGLMNGVLPFVSPPILIVWGSILVGVLNWGIGDLALYVGVPATIYSVFLTWKIVPLIEAQQTTQLHTKKLSFFFYVLVVLVGLNLWDYQNILVMAANILVGITILVKGHDLHEKLAPWILGALLAALEVIGAEATPFIQWLVGEVIPQNAPVFVVGIALFFVTAWISHVADNALASALILTAAVNSSFFVGNEGFISTSVLLGALAGGFLLIPANLPNFPIAKILKVESGAWLAQGIKIYYTMIFFPLWLVGLYFL